MGSAAYNAPMGFEQKLGQMVARGLDRGERDLLAASLKLADAIAAPLRDGTWATVRKTDQKDWEERLLTAKNLSVTYDAASYVRDAMQAARSRVIDLKVREFRAMQDQINTLFESGEAPARGFVYVAWRQSPETFLYVGKAGSRDRLKLGSHGKLVQALNTATCLSLVFPGQSRNDGLLALEACIIELVEFCTGSLPEWNDDSCPVPHHSGQELLDGMAAFLMARARDLKKDT